MNGRPPLAGDPIVGSWYCLPERELSLDALRTYAEAGFTHFQTLDFDAASGQWSPYSEAGNREALRLCERAGLRCFVVDERIYRDSRPLPPDAEPTERDLAAAVNAYQQSPALAGFLLYDEPTPHMYPLLGRVIARLRALDPNRLALVPMFPMHEDERFPASFEGRSYERYLAEFVETCAPPALAYDYYPFFDPARRTPQYLENFAIARYVADRAGLPFWFYDGILQPNASAEPATIGRLRVQVNLALAHGATAIFHYTYRSPSPGTGAPVDADGTLDAAAHAAIRTVNDEVLSHWRQTVGWRTSAVFHAGLAEADEEASVTVAILGPARATHAFVVNRDPDRDRSVRVRMGAYDLRADLLAGGAALLPLA